MNHSQKAKNIIFICMLLVGLFSAYVLYRHFWPSRGVPYEKATLSQAEEFMTYEKGYLLADVSDQETYAKQHMKDAVNIPYPSLIDLSPGLLKDKNQMIYVYGDDQENAKKAARKLCELGYTSITLIIPDEDAQTET